MISFLKFSVAALVVSLISWIIFVSFLPFLFIRQMERKYAIVLTGERFPILVAPRFKMKNAAFVWNDKVELVQGDFEIKLDPFVWLRERVWAMSLQGDGAQLRFLGDWLRKTGVSEVRTTRLRLALDFYDGDIREIHQVEVLSPDYQFQIQTRTAPR